MGHARAAMALLVLLAVLTSGCFELFRRDGAVGSAAEDLVSTKRYDNLLVEIDHPPGQAPRAFAVDELKRALSQVTQKKSIDVVLDASIPAQSKAYTYEEIARLEDEHRDHRSAGETAVLYVIYVGGTSAASDSTLGATYRGTSIVMFLGKIEGSGCTGLLCTSAEPQYIERAVLVHEFGHAAGLVGLGAPETSERSDAEHPGHSTDRGSVMYYAVETTAIFTVFTRGTDIPYQFSEADKADLKAMWA